MTVHVFSSMEYWRIDDVDRTVLRLEKLLDTTKVAVNKSRTETVLLVN